MREQPIDPQAEQEIIDSIEEVYFFSDSIDMVQYELEVCLLSLAPVFYSVDLLLSLKSIALSQATGEAIAFSII